MESRRTGFGRWALSVQGTSDRPGRISTAAGGRRTGRCPTLGPTECKEDGMTYPEPRYLGEGGERTATYRPADHAPELVYANGTTVHYLATGTATDGLFGLYRWEMGPEASGPGPHFHRSIAESFYVLRGNIRIYDGERWRSRRARRLRARATGRDPWLPQRIGKAGGDAPALRAGRAARGLLRGSGGVRRRGPAERRGASRRSTSATTTSGSEPSSMHPAPREEQARSSKRFAAEAGTSVERVRRLVEIGAIVPVDGTFSDGDVVRSRLLRVVRGRRDRSSITSRSGSANGR